MVKSKGDVLFNILVYVIIFTVGLICLIPVLFVISASVTPYSELLKNGGFVLIPRKFTNVAYVEMLADGALSHAMWVTVKLTVIATALEKKIKAELVKMQKDDREKYEKFWKAFGTQIKYGVVGEYGAKKDLLKDLLLFWSSKENTYTTLAAYKDRMPEDQKFVYYACGEDPEKIAKLPQVERILDKGYEILYFTDSVDEFAIRMLMKYKDKEFKSVSANDLNLESEEEKKELEQKETESKDMLETMQKALDGKVAKVKLSGRLKSHPVCLSNEGDLSMEMAKTLNAMPGVDQPVQAQTILELNPEHPIYQKLKTLDDETLGKYSQLLYNQALLIEGMPIADPVAFSNLICELMEA